MTRLCLLSAVALVLALFTSFALGDDPPATQPQFPNVTTGTMTYPAVDNLDLQEGTVEFWVKLGYDPAPFMPAKEFVGLAAVMQIPTELGGFSLGYSAGAGTSVPSWWCSMGPKPLFHSVPIHTILVQKDQWCHLAFAWKDNQITTFYDGKKINSMKFNAPFAQGFGRLLPDKPILIGNKYNARAMLVFDDLRISRIARSAEELGFHGPLQPDPFTAILDPFECDFTPDGKTFTQPSVILNGQGGLPSEHCRFVPGKFGKGLSLYDLGAQP